MGVPLLPLRIGRLFARPHPGAAEHGDGRADRVLAQGTLGLHQFQLQAQRPEIGIGKKVGILVRKAVGRISEDHGPQLLAFLKGVHGITDARR